MWGIFAVCVFICSLGCSVLCPLHLSHWDWCLAFGKVWNTALFQTTVSETVPCSIENELPIIPIGSINSPVELPRRYVNQAITVSTMKNQPTYRTDVLSKVIHWPLINLIQISIRRLRYFCHFESLGRICQFVCKLLDHFLVSAVHCVNVLAVFGTLETDVVVITVCREVRSGILSNQCHEVVKHSHCAHWESRKLSSNCLLSQRFIVNLPWQEETYIRNVPIFWITFFLTDFVSKALLNQNHRSDHQALTQHTNSLRIMQKNTAHNMYIYHNSDVEGVSGLNTWTY